MVSRPDFITVPDFKLLKEKYKTEKKLKRIIRKIEKDYPVQYAIGNVEFMGLTLDVDERVLVPRFETELLVSKLINYINECDLTTSNIIDICTGSGCIAISLKNTFINSSVTAIDKSGKALKVARKNADKYKLSIDFRKKDIFKKIDETKKYSLIVSNPPYVKKDEEVSKNTRFEPQMALYPGEDDIVFYKRILDISKNILEDKSIIAFEIGSTQAKRIIEEIKKRYKSAKIIVEKDYAGFDRFIFVFNGFE